MHSIPQGSTKDPPVGCSTSTLPRFRPVKNSLRGDRRRRAERSLRGAGCSVRSAPSDDAPSIEFRTSEGIVGEVSEPQLDYHGESTEGDLMLYPAPTSGGVIDILGLQSVDDIIDIDYQKLEESADAVMEQLNLDPRYPEGRPERGIYCSRTLNLRSIRCIGYDMDYTLIHYDVNAWEGKAYEYGLKKLKEMGYPTDGLTFDKDLVIRGLVVDKDLGNLVKVDRFGMVRRAMHGTRMLNIMEMRELYGRENVNLKDENRWYFLNTLFSVSEAVMCMQLVDLFDEGKIDGRTIRNLSYPTIYKAVSTALYRTHVEGALKAEIIQDPGSYVEVDPEMAETLLEQRDAGKRLLLITNSDYQYTNTMMSFAYDRFLPGNMKWRDMFDMVIINARKPEFFIHNNSLYEIVTPEGLMQPVLRAKKGGIYCGGSAQQVEKALDLDGVKGDDVLYVGDHIYTDAAMAKLNFRWRTALVIRELEDEIQAVIHGAEHREKLNTLQKKKALIGDVFNHLRLGTLPTMDASPFLEGAAGTSFMYDDQSRNKAVAQILMVMTKLDDEIGPMLDKDGMHNNERWGYLCRAGLNDKSTLCRQIEKWADIYTSRVSNFHHYTPYMYFQSANQTLAHDKDLFDRSHQYAPEKKQQEASKRAEKSTNNLSNGNGRVA